ncbi:MAG: hypothetical protein K2W96_04175 [Gemmataceae bacterium]|nr:hypothetical protein [Gemmataceae bacterium]
MKAMRTGLALLLLVVVIGYIKANVDCFPGCRVLKGAHQEAWFEDAPAAGALCYTYLVDNGRWMWSPAPTGGTETSKAPNQVNWRSYTNCSVACIPVVTDKAGNAVPFQMAVKRLIEGQGQEDRYECVKSK